MEEKTKFSRMFQHLALKHILAGKCNRDSEYAEPEPVKNVMIELEQILAKFEPKSERTLYQWITDLQAKGVIPRNARSEGGSSGSGLKPNPTDLLVSPPLKTPRGKYLAATPDRKDL